jgi:hypothetical protein
MALIRVLASRSNYRKWLEKNLAPAERMKDAFGFDSKPVSVYSVTVGIDEAKAIAAHYLTLKRNHIDTVWALRIEPHDLDDLGIEVQETAGDTGVAEVDAKHRDLLGSSGQFEVLAERLHDTISRGEDRLRALEKIQIEYHLQQFLHLDSSMVSDLAKNYCRKALQI